MLRHVQVISTVFAVSSILAGATLKVRTLYDEAVSTLDEGNTQLAIQKFKEAVAKEPSNPALRVGLIAAYLKIRKLEQADKELRGVIANPEVRFETLMQLERVFVKAGRYSEAIDILKVAEPRAPALIGGQERGAYFAKALGSLYEETRQTEDAVNVLRRAVREQPKNEDNYYQLALLMIQSGQMTGAYDVATEARSKFPGSGQILLSYALACYFAGRPDEAEKTYRQLVRMFPDSDEPYFALGNFYDDAKQPANAVEAFRRAVEKNPKNYLNEYMYGVAQFRLDKLEDARQAFEKALALNPRHADSWYWLGRIQLRSGLRNEALKSFTKAIDLEPKHLSAHYQLGLLYAQQGDRSRSRQMFETWRQLNTLAEENIVAERMP